MPYALDLTSHRPPRPVEAYQRTRLFRRLDQARAQAPLIWICSPPGSGKTTLVSSYLAYRQLACSWYQFDSADADPGRFLNAFECESQQCSRSKARMSARSVAKGQLPEVESAQQHFGELCARLAVPVLVFDDCQILPDQADTYGLLSAAFESVPEDVTVIFISRSAPPPALSRQYLNQDLTVLGWEDMQLTPEESLGIARMWGHRPREHGVILQAHEKATGWVAGFLLMLQEMKRGRQKRVHPPYAVERSIQDYFHSEVFSRLDPGTREFLMVTAQLQSMTSRMAEQLTGNSAAQMILEGLCHRQHFTERHELSNDAYQYHPLFRGYLLSQADELLCPEHLTALRRRAAALLEESGMIECAALQFIKIRDWPELVRLAARHAAGMLRQGRVQTIESWLLAVPVEVREVMPWSLYWLGACQITHTERCNSAHLERAFALFGQEGDAEGTLLSWAGVISARLAANEYAGLDTWIAWLDDRLETDRVFPGRDCEYRVVTSMFAALLYRQPHRSDLGAWNDRVRMCLRECADAAQIMTMARHLLRYQIWFGDPAGCITIMDVVRRVAQTQGQTTPIQIQCGVAESLYAWFAGDHDECLRLVGKTLDLALESGLHRWDFELYGIGACASMGLSRYSDARNWLQKMSMMLFAQPRSEAANYHYLSAWCAVAHGDLAGAHQHIDAAHSLYVNAGSVLQTALMEIGLTHICHERGERQQADEYLSCAQASAERTGSAQLGFLCGLMRYHQASCQGVGDVARSALAHTFATGRQQGYANTFWWQSRIMSEACALALSYGIETDYAQGLVRRHDLVLESPPLDIEHWPWQIRIYTLGRFTLLKQGQPLWTARKAQHKPLEMLKVLIAYGGREVSVDLLASVLWPDAEGDAAHNAFDITLHRLRKLIGSDKVVSLKDGRLTLDGRYCWVDTWAIERMIGQVDLALHNEKPSRDVDALMRKSSAVLSLYQGQYLAKEYSHAWAIGLRERLRSKFLRHVTDMGRFLESRQRWEEAVVYYQKGLEVDDLAEQFYQSLMLCYRQLERRSEALAVYRRCRSTLSIVLGIAPAPATEAIRASLLS